MIPPPVAGRRPDRGAIQVSYAALQQVGGMILAPTHSTLMSSHEYQLMLNHDQTHWWYRALHAWMGRAVCSFLRPGATILDAACGTGGILFHLRSLGYRAIGIDLSNRALQWAATRGSVLRELCCGKVEELPFRPHSFDGVVSCETLQLLGASEEQRALTEFKRVLRPGGMLIVNLPAYEWLRGEHDQAVLTKRRYTANRVRQLLAEAGFELLRVEYRGFVTLPFLALVRFMKRARRDAAAARSDLSIPLGAWNVAFTAVARLEERCGWIVRRPCGTSVAAVARVPV